MGVLFNYGLLGSGAHTVTIEIEDTEGSVTTKHHSIEVVRLGGFEFVDQFDLSIATARLDGELIIIEGVKIRDKISQQTKVIDVHLRWFENSQSLGVVATSE